MAARESLHAVTLSMALALGVGSPPTMGQVHVLDGKVFVGEAGEKGKSADEKNDVLSFQGGRFHSSACDKWGFGNAVYSASASDEAIAFETETKSEEHGRLVWKGVAKGDALEAPLSTIASLHSSAQTPIQSSTGSRRR